MQYKTNPPTHQPAKLALLALCASFAACAVDAAPVDESAAAEEKISAYEIRTCNLKVTVGAGIANPNMKICAAPIFERSGRKQLALPWNDAKRATSLKGTYRTFFNGTYRTSSYGFFGGNNPPVLTRASLREYPDFAATCVPYTDGKGVALEVPEYWIKSINGNTPEALHPTWVVYVNKGNYSYAEVSNANNCSQSTQQARKVHLTEEIAPSLSWP